MTEKSKYDTFARGSTINTFNLPVVRLEVKKWRNHKEEGEA